MSVFGTFLQQALIWRDLSESHTLSHLRRNLKLGRPVVSERQPLIRTNYICQFGTVLACL